jgi:integrase
MAAGESMKMYLPLSAERIKSAKPEQSDIWLADSNGSRNTGRLLLRVAPTGTRRFYFRYSVAGTRKTVPLGIYSHLKSPGRLTLSEARELAIQMSSTVYESQRVTAVEYGKVNRPAEPTRTQIPTTPIATTDERPTKRFTFLELCQAYLDWQVEMQKPAAKETRYAIKNYIANSDLAELPASFVKPAQISALLRGVVEAGHGRTAAKVRSVLHAAYARALGAELNPSSSAALIDSSLESNPVSAIPSLSEYCQPRHRALTKAEFVEVWRRLRFDESNVNNLAVRALRLGVKLAGQRCEQLVRVPLTDVDLDGELIVLEDWKGNRTKPRLHVVPLSKSCLEEVEWLITHSQSVGSKFLFASHLDGKHVCAGTVSRLVTDMRREMMAAGTATSQFQFSDLRRTIETTLSSYGVSKDHRAQLLSHGISGIQARHYDMYDYLQEKREALGVWERHLALVDAEIDRRS